MPLKTLLVYFLLSTICSVAIAQDKTLSLTVYQRLSEIEKLTAEDKIDSAQNKLNKMIKHLPKRATDQAYIYYQQASLYLQQEKYTKALEFYDYAYRLDALNKSTQAGVIQMLADLSMHEGEYQRAVDYLNSYFSLSEEANTRAYLSLGTAYFQLKEYGRAIAPLRTLTKTFEPNESATVLLFACYYEQGQLAEAAALMSQAIRHWPNEGKYWLQLASVYLELEKTEQSLEILELAYKQNLLLNENSLLQYIYTLYESGLPNKAANVLATLLERSYIQKNYQRITLLASLQLSARENKKALKSYQLAASLSDSGEDHLYLAQLYFDSENYTSVITHGKTALLKGVKEPGSIHMLLAATYFELGKPQQLKNQLKLASQFETTKQVAEQWLQNIGR